MIRLRYAALAVSALTLAACSMFQIQDTYGNRYGGWYEHGDSYRYQMTLCERQTGAAGVAVARRPAYMRQCMWSHGVPRGNTTPAAGT